MADHHDHAHHSGHAHVHSTNRRAIGLAAALTGVFMLVEVVGGLVSGSLALIADAGHMLTDFAALVLAWWALVLSGRPADGTRTYGFDRVSVLAAFVNGLSLFVIAGWITVEAVERLRSPGEIMGGLMLGVAVAGLCVNIAAFWILTRGDSENLNVRAAALHVAGDLLGSVAAIVAAVVIIATGWTPIDPLLSVLVALIILRSAWAVVRDAGHILLEGTPRGFDRDAVAARIADTVDGVERVHHMHAWSITQERPMVTLEVDIRDTSDASRIRTEIKALLREDYGVDHATVEITG